MKAKYVDGFVIPVKRSKLNEYKKIAKKACKIWLGYGALAYYEAVGDDLNIKGITNFKKIAKAKTDEVVIFSWITYKSKAHRNSVNKKVMLDDWMKNFDPTKNPFDPRRMAYGGFKIIVTSK